MTHVIVEGGRGDRVHNALRLLARAVTRAAAIEHSVTQGQERELRVRYRELLTEALAVIGLDWSDVLKAAAGDEGPAALSGACLARGPLTQAHVIPAGASTCSECGAPAEGRPSPPSPGGEGPADSGFPV